MRKGRLFSALSMILMVARVGFAENERASVLKLALLSQAEEIHELPLTSMLSNLGSRVKEGYVLFGVEVLLKEGKEPVIAFPRRSPGDLGTGLRDVLRQLPGYEMEIVSDHLIDISPRQAKADPRDLLNTRVPNFGVENAPALSILAFPERFIPELYTQIHPAQPAGTRDVEIFSGPYSPPISRITLQLRNVTIRDILNRVSEATEHLDVEQPPFGWVYKLNSDGAPGFPKHSWASHSSVPNSWRKQRSPDRTTK